MICATVEVDIHSLLPKMMQHNLQQHNLEREKIRRGGESGWMWRCQRNDEAVPISAILAPQRLVDSEISLTRSVIDDNNTEAILAFFSSASAAAARRAFSFSSAARFSASTRAAAAHSSAVFPHHQSSTSGKTGNKIYSGHERAGSGGTAGTRR